MKIKKVESEQFAGIKNISIDFSDNLNVIYGKNESGKSTRIDLIYSMLFQNALLKKNSDKSFIEKSFPQCSDGTIKDFIEGQIEIENEKDIYKLSKEWAVKTGTAKMKDASESIIKDEKAINDKLSEILKYGEGVYKNIIFTSQKIPQTTLDSIFEDCKKDDIKKELRSILMQSAASLGGADVDAIENKINEKLKDLGNHFDIKTMAPEGGINKEWKKEVGAILDCYYKLKNLKKEKDKIIALEDSIDKANKEKREFKDELAKIYNNLNGIAGVETLVEKRNHIEDNYKNQQKVEEDASRDYKTWETFVNEKVELEKNKCEEVSKADIDLTNNTIEAIKINEAKLSALSLSAKIDNKSNKTLKVSNIDNGKVVNEINGEYDIKGCTEIDLDGLINIKLFPKDVDVDKLKNELDENRSNVNNIYKKYQVNNIDELKDKYEKYRSYIEKKENIDNNYEKYIKQYEEKYDSLDGLEATIKKVKSEQELLIKQISDIVIPEEYEGISNFDSYKNEKKDRIKKIDDEIVNIDECIQDNSAELAGRDSDSIKEQLEPLEYKYNNIIQEYKHYDHIYQVFNELKQEMKTDPMSNIDSLFEQYLGIISSNGITTNIDNDKVIMASKNNALTLETLSEGTKETIGLAFKLAVIENLFPDGGGLAIFDDSFTDLDEDRRNEACSLIKEFAKKNQVIFATCDKVYLDLFKDSNIIKV